jgi:multidrug efflux pump subunit AcrA (membrane-fusion protein)
LELADFTSLLVEADVSEGRLAVVKAGGPCEIVLDAIPSERFQGEVVEVGPRLNRSKATATVKVRFKAPPAELRPEMSARVSFLQKPLDEAQLKETAKNVVPAAAVVERAGGKAVYVLDAGKVKLVPVTLGEALGSGFVLKEGPAPGTRVVKDPPRDLADGQSVKEKTS